MIVFFRGENILAVEAEKPFAAEDVRKLEWLFSGATKIEADSLEGYYVGTRRETITPWSTNAVEITQNMGLTGISRIEEFFAVADANAKYDPMLQTLYKGLDQKTFTIDKQPDPIVYITDFKAYNAKEGLALSDPEIEYLEGLSKRLGRPLTDSEVFGFSQVNSEHCRHKIFNGTFIIDGVEKELSLFKLIRRTSDANPGDLVSAYKDNVAFKKGPEIEQFAPERGDVPSYFAEKKIDSVISLKAETHNFPTTVEPFNGAATGSGGEIRDRMGGGTGSLPMAGTAVYMTSYSRLADDRPWEKGVSVRDWLYQTPAQILIKASNGASDFGNKFGQPMIAGSVLTFEHEEDGRTLAYDKVIMMAGGVGFAKASDALKKTPEAGQKVVVLGGDNYRIGMGGGAVSSVNTGEYGNKIELNAVQRSNPEMQKRVLNAIRALVESDNNPIVSIHDHGAGGHLNCLSELVEETGGNIDMDALPVGDKTLSDREIVGNESQERMGLVLKKEDVEMLRKVSERERAPMYVVGETTGDMNFTFSRHDGTKPIDWKLSDMFGNPPKTIMRDETVVHKYAKVEYEASKIGQYALDIMKLESVGCKDWLTNKVDRSVTGKVAKQQCAGELQLPLNDVGVMALDYHGEHGIATSIGHAPGVGLIDPSLGSIMSVAEALTNLVFAHLEGGVPSISLSANWMWPCRQKGEDARLYQAVQAMSDWVSALGVNIPTGKDSLSMTQKYHDGRTVLSPGTVIISAMAETDDIRGVVEPVLQPDFGSKLVYIDMSGSERRLGGSALAQVLGKVGDKAPEILTIDYFLQKFVLVQELVKRHVLHAGHDISAGGILTTLAEMAFANTENGLAVDLSKISEDAVLALFSENPGVVLQVKDWDGFLKVVADLKAEDAYIEIGSIQKGRKLDVKVGKESYSFDIDALRDEWYSTSAKLDALQSGAKKSAERFANYKQQPIRYAFPKGWDGSAKAWADALRKPGDSKAGRPRAAIIREKGVNGDREMAYSLYVAGFDVKDVHMTDLVSGRETLEEVNMIVFCGGFSNSDVLGSAKGWAGAFLYNPKAKEALEKFYAREDTLSLGVCNGCQLVIELGLLHTDTAMRPKMLHNDSHKFESNFLTLTVPQNDSVMFGNLSGSQLGIWVAHGEGKFSIPQPEGKYNIVAKYLYSGYPGNPNGSDANIAGMASADGRHVAIMPHLERAIFPWQCGFYPKNGDVVTPWIKAFINARNWVENKTK